MDRDEPWRTLIVTPADSRVRLDVFVAGRLSDVSRRRAQRLIADGTVLVGGRAAVKGLELIPGDRVEILRDPGPAGWTARPDPDLELIVAHKDPLFIAADKPSGIPTVPLAHDETGTLAGALVARFPECAELGRSPGDAGLLHRLDRETSGLVLAARTQEAFATLHATQRDGRIEKRYLALVAGRGAGPPRSVDARLGPTEPGGTRVRYDPDGTYARTWFAPVLARGDWLLVEAVIHLGFRHQIRAHLAHAGYPIAGDTLYGGPALPGLERLFLHAAGLRLPHPRTGNPLQISSDLPPDLAAVVTRAGSGPSRIG